MQHSCISIYYMYIHNIYIYTYTYLIDSSTRQFRQLCEIKTLMRLNSENKETATHRLAGTGCKHIWYLSIYTMGKFTFFEHKNGGWFSMIFPLQFGLGEVPWCSMSMFFGVQDFEMNMFFGSIIFFPRWFRFKTFERSTVRLVTSFPFCHCCL